MKKNFTRKWKVALLAGILLSWGSAMAQTTVITGTVTGPPGNEPIPGVNVIAQGTTSGSITDIDGNYKINVSDEVTALIFSFIGYETKEVSIGGRTSIDVVLDEDIETLEEVVIVGYGTESKKMATGSYTKVDAKGLSQKVSSSFQEGLQGMAAGMDVTGASGAVGGAINIRIRGTGSFSSNANPLYVIDGIPYTSYPTDGLGNFGTVFNPLTNINPQDIASMTVLKDAEATSIYGSRGANGVIIVTTKTGQKGKAKFEVSYSQGISEAANVLDHLGTEQWIDYLEESWDNAGTPVANRKLPYTTDAADGWYTDEVARSIDDDKFDRVYRQGMQRNASLAVSGGNDKVTYRINGAYSKAEGILERNDNERVSFAGNLDVQLTPKMKAGINMSVSNTKNSQFPTNIYFLNAEGHTGGVFQYFSNPTGLNFIRNSLPMYPIYNPDGTFFQGTGLSNVGPALDPDYFKHESYSFNSMVSGSYQYKITPDLTFDATFGLNYIGYRRDVFFSPFVTTPSEIGCDDCKGYAERMMQHRFYLNSNATLKYNKAINLNVFETLVGVETFSENNNYLGLKGVGFPKTNSISNVGSAQEPIEWKSEESGVVFYSAFARFKYAYDQRYIIGLSARADGSSRFGAANRWGVFPAASVGWNISQESFMDDASFIDFLKVRASYGVTGNAEIDQSAAFYNWNFNSVSYAGGQGVTPLRLQGSTDNIGWERAYTLDVGVDFELFDKRLRGEVGYFNRRSTDLLAKLSLPPTSGGGSFIANTGSILNKGIEMSLTTDIIRRAVTWSTSINVTHQKNEVLSLGTDVDPTVFQTNARVGIPVVGGSVSGYELVKWLGVDPQTGYEMFEDPETGQAYQFADPERPTQGEMQNLVQTIDGKDGVPDWYGSITNNIGFKGFNLSFQFYFKQGLYLYDDELTQMAYMGKGNQLTNVPQFMYDERWQQPGDQTDVPRMIYDHPLAGNPARGNRSTRFLYDGSFVRLRNVTVSYNFPSALCQRLGMTSVRIFATGTNLLTFTKYPGWDPESLNSVGSFSPSAANIEPGLIKGNPPQAKVYKLGVHFTF
ncbi:TonB-dependent receptor [Reichenbachiella carrageenanivorans]|uniref:TonB-dependent receptor n=1 Tax=Reichenbachiella carrageenanivorans TaxID=2979869 RepID=A0ABY6D4B2_9BACT|nr:TonB-dependent receptor [Reichenbachiella carrageenanivorans]UXX80999.1 TonB-dependent receptor [Reichenbachiella carrageenanivorans]